MSVIPVCVKHAGTKYELELDTSLSGEVFKMQLYSITGVEPDRQKILIKGGQLKDNTDLTKLQLKPNHVFMLMGTPADGARALRAPKETVKFLEDMTDKDLAGIKGAIPAGLQNLGNTCYMNSTLQTLRSVPELQTALTSYQAPGGGDSRGSSSALMSLLGAGPAGNLTSNLRDLFKQMNETIEGFPPLMFVNALRSAFPQFDQKDRQGRYAQQDAEECWSQIVTNLRSSLEVTSNGDEKRKFVDAYFGGKMQVATKCVESPEEPVIESEDTFLKLDCHITNNTNLLRDGILASLTENIEKRSEKLGRDAVFQKTSRVARLPKYLTCHFVRFFWRKDINKKTKIMRKVLFPFQLDATEFCTDELKTKLIPVRDKLRNLIRDEEERIKYKRKERTVFIEAVKEGEGDAKDKMDVDEKEGNKALAEGATKPSEKKEEDWDLALAPLLDDELSADDGANQSGLYELHGVITHKGASADSGHYCSYIRKPDDLGESIEGKGKGKSKSATGLSSGGSIGAEESKWWFFDDERVTEVGWDRIETLAGGGESHSALILLYKAVDMTPKLKPNTNS